MYAIGLAAYLHFVIGPNVDEEEVARRQATKNKRKEVKTVQTDGEEGTKEEGLAAAIVPDMIPEDAMFIPLGWARQLPETVYKGSDPEWQGFIEFSQDRKRGQRIRSLSPDISPLD